MVNSRLTACHFNVVWVKIIALALAVSAVALGTEVDTADGACVTTATAATTVGATSLMQAVSTRGKFGSDQLKEDSGTAQVLASQRRKPVKQSAQILFQQNATVVEASIGSSGKESRLQSAFASISSFIHGGEELVISAFRRFFEKPRSGSSMSAGVMFLLFSSLFMIAVIVSVSVFNPGGLRKFGRSLSGSQLEQDGQEESNTRANQLPPSARTYFPMTASPQLSMRGHRGSPEQSQKRLPLVPEVSKPSPARRSLATGATLSTGADDKAMKTASAAQSQFCPDLVVPQHCECILVLPLDLGKANTSFTITDVNGSPVLRAVPQPAAPGRLWRATITTAVGDTLVQCCEHRPKTDQNETEFHLQRGAGQFFAKLTYSSTQDRYLLTLPNGSLIHFWGNFDNSAVNITDDGNRLLATTEIGSADFDPKGTYCRLRVAPMADVGLSLCGLLCIGQHMANNARGTL